MNKLKQIIITKLGEKNVTRLKRALPKVRIAKNIVCWVLVAILGVAIITFLLTRMSGNSPTLFGYSLHRVISNSMEPELEVGDIFLSKRIDDSEAIRVGDIVTFKGGRQFNYENVTHRVLVEPYDNGKGEVVLVTKGDANNVDDGEININNIMSVFVKKLGFIRWIYDFFFSVWGLVVFILLLLLIFVDSLISSIKQSVTHDEGDESFFETMKRIEREERNKAGSKQYTYSEKRNRHARYYEEDTENANSINDMLGFSQDPDDNIDLLPDDSTDDPS